MIVFGTICLMVIHGVMSLSSLKYLSYVAAIGDFCAFSSLFHVVVIAKQRFFAIFSPLRFRQIYTRKRSIIVLVLVWIASAALSTIFYTFSLYIIGSYIIFGCGGATALYYVLIWRHSSKRANVANSTSAQAQIDNATRRIMIHAVAITISFILFMFPSAIVDFFVAKNPTFIIAKAFVILKMLFDPLMYFFIARKKNSRNDNLHRFQSTTAAVTRNTDSSGPTNAAQSTQTLTTSI